MSHCKKKKKAKAGFLKRLDLILKKEYLKSITKRNGVIKY
jgi:hypothetical protein